ncbi:hypothetical protein RN001_000409 [Aquatica leii]|uniref:DUF7041 domain-containing protein n=1 Tax=Aquatica leii TaxID=1421715 RepID=A0AAN7PF98_9COLE|nr:hypothetical protein RN001_000409 [Aquatica leii]
MDRQNLALQNITRQTPFLPLALGHHNLQIYDTTKFNYTIANLENEYIQEIKDILLAPPAQQTYDKLKTELIARLSISQEQNIRRLLEHEEIGDRTPSQFMRHLRNLAGNDVSEKLLQSLWRGRLPHSMQAILAAAAIEKSLDDQAVLADTIFSTMNTSFQAVVQVPTSTGATQTQLEAKIEALTRQVAELTKLSNRERSYSRSRYRHRSNSRSKQYQSTSGLCWYHYKFKSKARKCVEPCNFHKQEN